MIFKYWVEFDEDGEIKALHKFKSGCETACKEYVVKLIPISRKNEELVKNADKAAEAAKRIVKGIKKLDIEVHKAVKDLRRLKI
jgi:hypothetical protein